MPTNQPLSDFRVFVDAGKIAARLGQLAARVAYGTLRTYSYVLGGHIIDDEELQKAWREDQKNDPDLLRSKLHKACAERPELLSLVAELERFEELLTSARGRAFVEPLPLPEQSMEDTLLEQNAIGLCCADNVEAFVRAGTPDALEIAIEKSIDSMKFRMKLLDGVKPGPIMMEGIQALTMRSFCEAVLGWAASIWFAAAEFPCNDLSDEQRLMVTDRRATYGMRYIWACPTAYPLSENDLRDLVGKMQGKIRALEKGGKSSIYLGPRRDNIGVWLPESGPFAKRPVAS